MTEAQKRPDRPAWWVPRWRAVIMLSIFVLMFWRFATAVPEQLGILPVPKPGAVIDMTAHEILQPMEDVYTHCDSYRDIGVSEMDDDKGRRLSVRSFSLHFPRDAGFRFERREVHPDSLIGSLLFDDDHQVVWGTAKQVQTWRLRDKGRVKESVLSYGLVVSDADVAYLLLPDVTWSNRCYGLEDASVEGLERRLQVPSAIDSRASWTVRTSLRLGSIGSRTCCAACPNRWAQARIVS